MPQSNTLWREWGVQRVVDVQQPTGPTDVVERGVIQVHAVSRARIHRLPPPGETEESAPGSSSYRSGRITRGAGHRLPDGAAPDRLTVGPIRETGISEVALLFEGDRCRMAAGMLGEEISAPPVAALGVPPATAVAPPRPHALETLVREPRCWPSRAPSHRHSGGPGAQGEDELPAEPTVTS